MKIWVIGRHYPAINNKMRGSFEIEQAKMLARGGHDVTYIAVVFHPYKKIRKWGYSSWQEDNINVFGYSHVFFPEKMKIQMSSFRARVFDKVLRKAEEKYGTPDIIHVHFPTMTVDAKPFFRFSEKGCKVVCTEHWSCVLTKELKNNQVLRLKRYVKGSDAFLCVGEPLKNSVIELTGTKKPVYVVPNVVADMFVPGERKTDPGIFTFTMVERIAPVKQTDKVIKAFYKIHKKHKNTRLMLVGNGEIRLQIENLVNKLGLNDSVEMTGTVKREEVVKRLADSDCLLCYSKYETFGVPIIEAWACGIPVISSNTVGLIGFWQDDLGYLADPDDTNSLINKMELMLENRNDFSGEKIREYCMANFSEKAVLAQLEKLYNDIADKNK